MTDIYMKTYLFLLILLLCTYIPAASAQDSAEGLYRQARAADTPAAWWAYCTRLLEEGDPDNRFPDALERGRFAALRTGRPLDMAGFYDCRAEHSLASGDLDAYLPDKLAAYNIYKGTRAREKEAESCIYLGNYYNATGQYDSALVWLTRMDGYARSHPKEASYNLMLSCLADTYYRMGQVDSAVVKEEASARYSIEAGDTLTLLGSYRALGMYHRSQGRLSQALEAYGQALALLSGDSRPDRTEERASLYTNLSMLCLDMKQREDALRYARLASEETEKVQNDLLTVQLWSNLGRVFMEYADYPSATACIDRGLSLSSKMNDRNMLLRNLGYLLRLKRLQGDAKDVDSCIRSARRLLPHVSATNTLAGYYQEELDARLEAGHWNDALRTCKDLLAVPGIEGKPFILDDVWRALSLCYEKTGHYPEALASLRRHAALSDSLRDSEHDRALQELNIKYETREKELRLAQAETERRVADERHRMNLFLLCVLIIMLVQAATAIIVWMRKKNERMRRYAEQQEQAFRLLRSETELRLTRQWIDGMEAERNRLARELHDGISNDLYALEIRLQGELPASSTTAEVLADIRENVRSISHELMPPSFSQLTLCQILQTYVEGFASTVPAITFDFRADPPDAPWGSIPQSTAIVLYRVVQEALGNIVRHAAATRVYVGIELARDTLYLYVKDNGQGRPTSAAHAGGIGLHTMKERIEALHGTFAITHAEGRGTLVKCTLPLHALDTDTNPTKQNDHGTE